MCSLVKRSPGLKPNEIHNLPFKEERLLKIRFVELGDSKR